MLKAAVILNGPPGVGKDTIANLLTEHGFVKHQFKDQLYKDTANFFGIGLAEFIQKATDRDLKEERWVKLIVDGAAITPREALIHVSENIIKPTQGADYFGKAAARACVAAGTTLAVFPDGGFGEEVSCLSQVFQEVVIFRLHRYAYDWDGDSRRYLTGFPDTFDAPITPGHPEYTVNEILEELEDMDIFLEEVA